MNKAPLEKIDKLEVSKQLILALKKYAQPKNGKAIVQMITTFVPFLGLWTLMYLSLSVSYWLTLGLGIINAFFLVRIFIIQHDCGHNSFLKNAKLRHAIGAICGFISTIPYKYWAKSHHMHHAHNGQLELRDIGDITTLTAQEYKALSARKRFGYRLYRSPIVMFFFGPIYYVLIHNRFPIIKLEAFKKLKRSVWVNNIIIGLAFVALCFALDWWKIIVTHGTVLVIFSVIAVWFFYVQHQHEAAYKQWKNKWDYLTAAVKGSTYYKLPGIFNWLTGNIGIHHLHHLNPAIPNYNLKKCIKENPSLNQMTTVIGFWDSLKLMSHKLWDEHSQRMITFREFYQKERLGLI